MTEAGFEIDGIPALVEFDPFFAILVAGISCLLGICAIVILGTTFQGIYKHFAEERKQFRFYFFAASLSAFFVNLVIIVVDFIKVPEWCGTTHFDYIRSATLEGCDGTIITKIIYFIAVVFLSLIAAGLSSRSYEIINLENKRLRKHERLIYIILSWGLILSGAFVAWSAVPTILQIMIYPGVILSITFVMIATVFWFTVLFSVPSLFVSSINKRVHCVYIYLYFSPIGGMIVFVFLFGLVTVCYLNAIVFGTHIGGLLSVLAATIPSILLTVATELYRDWFLTHTTKSGDTTERSEKIWRDGFELGKVCTL